MADRRVTRSRRDTHGDVTCLCGRWGEVSKAEAIDEIERGIHRYYVQHPGTEPADVVVVRGLAGSYLRTTAHSGSTTNNLLNLPDR